MKKIEQHFNERFSTWEITLPPDDIENRRRGKIVKAGWAIWYLFGSDDKGEYLDYYASHRMTNDRHVRIHADGHCEGLPEIQEFRICSEDPQEDARLDAEYYAENQRIAKMLEEKGLGPSGDEPGGVLINRFLYTRKVDE
jgi:hypothetical protein